jgi:glyoxylase-like metal-dependent hydrolase (beta-lactamase superfamily II)
MSESLPQRALGATTVLFGERGGRYPQGNSLHVRGAWQEVLIDPSLGMLARKGDLPRADSILHSHCHEDHVAGSHLYLDRPWWFHEADLLGIRSIDDFLAIYGYPKAISDAFRPVLTQRFHVNPRGDAQAFADGHVFELGGGVRIRAIHAPGHTRGHCLFHVEPDDVLYLADIDLSSFGPYYGDAWSDLEQFERTLARVRELRARHYATFHHIGVIDERDAFLARLDRFRGVIGDREARLLEYLREPRTLDEIARHRFVYRPGDDIPFAEAVELRSMGQHVQRLLRAGRVREVEVGRYFAG